MIIAIDGPAGSGKSSTAREVALRLGFVHMDSGALYRAFAVAACERGWASPVGEVGPEDLALVAEVNVDATVSGQAVTVTLDGRSLAGELRSATATACASKISTFPEIRTRVNQVLRRLASEYTGGLVCEGRDMGTVVFPEADLKIYMHASPKARARRRLLQQGREPTAESMREEAARLLARDTADSERELSPLRPAKGALAIDTTHLSLEEQVERIVREARARLDTT